MVSGCTYWYGAIAYLVFFEVLSIVTTTIALVSAVVGFVIVAVIFMPFAFQLIRKTHEEKEKKGKSHHA